mmetsp:Transcript_32676/g.36409  ORF Transcript_32676/g.36409 Transcript_32676/m.36409 type:complete len:328 (-) Transcript_32676:155-1138(-)
MMLIISSLSSLLMLAIASSSTRNTLVRAFATRSIQNHSNLLSSRIPSPTSTTKRTMIGNILNMFGGGQGAGLISPAEALPGRAQKMANIDGLRHYVLGNKLEEVPEGYKVAIFANGCFWGSEKGIWRFPYGIHSTAVGYCGGFSPNPTYEEACSGQTGHTEGVRVVYNPELISYVDIMRWFWEAHDPASGMGQGNDRGTQYRSGFYYDNEEEKQLLEASRDAYEAKLTGDKKITTEIAAAADYEQYGGIWFFGEPYHQQYLSKPGARPYCSAQPQGVSVPDFDDWCPEDLKEKYKPKLPESFWKKYAPKRGCSIISEPNAVILESSY